MYRKAVKMTKREIIELTIISLLVDSTHLAEVNEAQEKVATTWEELLRSPLQHHQQFVRCIREYCQVAAVNGLPGCVAIATALLTTVIQFLVEGE